MAKNYTLYKHIFPNGKVYIGITSTSVEKRWNYGKGYSDQFIGNAIKKYGWNNVKHEILATNLSKKEADKLEKQYIKECKSYIKEYGYNIDLGGVSDNKTYGSALKNSNSKKGTLSHEMTCLHTPEANKKASEKKKGMLVNNKPVICIETGKIYSSATECGKDMNIREHSITRVCRGEREKTHNMHFRYLNKSDKCYKVYIIDNQIGHRKYIGITKNTINGCIHNGKTFKSCQKKIYEAIKIFGWDNFNVRVCYCVQDKLEAQKRKNELIDRYDTIANGYNSYYEVVA